MSKTIALKQDKLKGISRMAVKMESMNLGAKQGRLVKAVQHVGVVKRLLDSVARCMAIIFRFNDGDRNTRFQVKNEVSPFLLSRASSFPQTTMQPVVSVRSSAI